MPAALMDTNALTTHSESRETHANGPLDHETIDLLLIEDNPGDVVLIRTMLAETGATNVMLSHATSLAGGIALLDEHRYSAVLTDLNLPDS